MSLKIQGRIQDYYADGVAIQPGYKLTQKDDGTLDGTVTFECDRDRVGSLPQIGADHPADGRAELYARDITYMGLNKVSMTGSYFGLISATTDPIITNGGSADREAIETHSDFLTMAGTDGGELNGAKFDEETGEFLGFLDSSNDLFGVRYYFTASTTVSSSFWTRSAPKLKKILTIVDKIPGYKAPEGVKNFLLLSVPYRQVGSHYQVTENFLGSGADGWNTTIYPE
tara:strand:- start:60 stop:743 length:684 start_codon:yes stop_codon:yes gene_type:complete